MAKKIVYSEPEDYFPKDLRKKFGVGEFNKEYWDERKKQEAADREIINKGLREIAKK